ALPAMTISMAASATTRSMAAITTTICRGGQDDDIVNGDAGNDWHSVTANYSGDNGNTTDIADIIVDDSGSHTLHGYDLADQLSGGAGDDIIYGEAGDDSIHGDSGNDSLRGCDGSDTIYGGEGNDTLYGSQN